MYSVRVSRSDQFAERMITAVMSGSFDLYMSTSSCSSAPTASCSLARILRSSAFSALSWAVALSSSACFWSSWAWAAACARRRCDSSPISWSTRAFMLSIWLSSEPEVDWIRLSSSCFWAIFEAGSPSALWPIIAPITSVQNTISETTARRPLRVVRGRR